MAKDAGFTGRKMTAWNPAVISTPLSLVRMGLTAAMITSLLVGAILGVRIVDLGAWQTPAGSVIFPFTYAILLIVAEVYGIRTSVVLALCGIGALTTAALLFEFTDSLPPAHLARSVSFHLLFGAEPLTLFASVFGFGIGVMAGLGALYVLAIHFDGQLLWARIIGVPLISQVATSAVLFPVVFFHRLPLAVFVHLYVDRLAFAVAFAAMTAPFLYAAIIATRNYERPTLTALLAIVRDLRDVSPQEQDRGV